MASYMPLFRRCVIRLAVSLCYACVLAAPVLAQSKKGEDRPPPWDVNGLEATRPWIPWAFAFLFAVACAAIAFKNPHRSHMD